MELITLTDSTIGDHLVQTVHARDLYAFLGARKDFSTWIKDRIVAYGFVENRDFMVSPDLGENPSGGRPAKDYHLTLDMAKELAMVERNEKGKQARSYFIECERRTKAIDPMVALNDPTTLRKLLLGQTEKRIELEARVETMKGDVVAFERIAKADGSLTITESAKSLQVRPVELFRWLQAHGWIYKRPGAAHWLGYQSKTSAGFLEHKVEAVVRGDGAEKIVEQVRVTPKGLTKLSQAFPITKTA